MAADTRNSSWLWSSVALAKSVAASLMPQLRHCDAEVRDVFWDTCRLLQYDARAAHDTSTRLAALANMHILLCGGTKDGICPKANIEAMLAQLQKDGCKNAAAKYFEGSHFFHRESPQPLATISEFLLGVPLLREIPHSTA